MVNLKPVWSSKLRFLSSKIKDGFDIDDANDDKLSYDK